MKLIENEFFTISLDSKVPCIEWLGTRLMDSDSFRESEWKYLEFFEQYKKKYPKLEGFVDARDVGLISTADTSWVANEILPRFADAGMTKEAFLVPQKSLGKLIVKNFISKAGQTIEIKLFSSETEAKSWLKS